MKSIKTILASTVMLSVALASCSNYGKKYELDKFHTVYYKGEGTDEATAKKLAEYLKEAKYFLDEHTAAVQIAKSSETKDTVYLNFVVDKAKVTGDIEKDFLQFGPRISDHVFNKAPINIRLMDENFKEIKNLGPATEPATAKEEINMPSNNNGNYTNASNNNSNQNDNDFDLRSNEMPATYKQVNDSRIYYNSTAAQFVPSLQTELIANGFFAAGNTSSVVVLTQGSTAVLKIALEEASLKDPALMQEAAQLSENLQSKIFDGYNFSIWICDVRFNPVRSYGRK